MNRRHKLHTYLLPRSPHGAHHKRYRTLRHAEKNSENQHQRAHMKGRLWLVTYCIGSSDLYFKQNSPKQKVNIKYAFTHITQLSLNEKVNLRNQWSTYCIIILKTTFIKRTLKIHFANNFHLGRKIIVIHSLMNTNSMHIYNTAFAIAVWNAVSMLSAINHYLLRKVCELQQVYS